MDQAAAAEEPVLTVLCALLETERVPRSRYKLGKASIAGAFTALLEGADVEFEHPPTVEEALYVWARHPGADFADRLLSACAAHLGRRRFLSFDVGAPRSPGVELLAQPVMTATRFMASARAIGGRSCPASRAAVHH